MARYPLGKVEVEAEVKVKVQVEAKLGSNEPRITHP
jgi:hypothetical protein